MSRRRQFPAARARSAFRAAGLLPSRASAPSPENAADPITELTGTVAMARAAYVTEKLTQLLGGSDRGTMAIAGAAILGGQDVRLRADGLVEPVEPDGLAYGTALAAAQPGESVVVAFTL